jgi:N-methylhydantoinase B
VITAGGMGALPFRDGLSATGFPSGVRGGSIEVFETMSSVIVWRKDLRPGSGGAGKWRGGLGQIIEIENGIDAPFNFGATFEHVRQPARGAFGGHSGATGSVRLRSGQSFGGKGQFTVPPGDRLIVESAGGGGWGEPSARAPEDIERDRRNGLVSADAAVPDGQHQSSTKDRS